MNNLRTRFRPPWDMLLFLMTGGFLILLFSLGFALGSMIVIVFNWSIIIACIVFGVYGYSIQDGTLKIVRMGWSKDVALDSIKQVEKKPMAMMGSIRIFGIGGVFGYIGNFKNSILGRYKAYVTHRKKTVLITTVTDQQLLISPDDPAEFIKSLKSAIARESEINNKIDEIFRETGCDG